MPFISVVVPVYNVEKYLRRCVESLLVQGYKDCEIILVDDGSKDSSGELCDVLAKKFDNVKAVHKENGGLASARNYGLNYINGKYVVFVDSDDTVYENFFSFIDEHLKRNSVDILKYGYREIQNGKTIGTAIPYYDEGLYDREKIMDSVLPGAIGPIRLFDYSKIPLLSACACAYSVDFLKKNNLIFKSEREILNEDYLFNFEVLLCAQSAEITHEILYIYDFREGSLSKRYVINMLQRKHNFLKAYKTELIKKNLFERYEIPFYNQCIDSFYDCITNECGAWSDKSKATKNISKILNDKLCTEAIKKCDSSNLGLKGNAIYLLMKMRAAGTVKVLYKMAKKLKAR